MATTFETVVPNICEPRVGNLLSVTVLAPTIVRWRLHFLICASLSYSLTSSLGHIDWPYVNYAVSG